MNKALVIRAICVIFLFAMPMPIVNATLIAASPISVEDGLEVDGKWINGYWVLTFAVNQADNIYGSLMIASGANASTGNTTVIAQKSVEVRLTPLRAYYYRALKDDSVLVTPRTYRAGESKITMGAWADLGTSVEALSSGTYNWATSYWEKYTEWQIDLYVEGVLNGSSVLNQRDGSNTAFIDTDKGQVRVENLGMLQGSKGEPQVSSSIILFNKDYIFDYSSAIRYLQYDYGSTTIGYRQGEDPADFNLLVTDYFEPQVTSEAYSVYWYGFVRWGYDLWYHAQAHNTPAPWTYRSPAVKLPMLPNGKGWTDTSTMFDFAKSPVQASIYPAGKPTIDPCVVEYLSAKSANIASSFIKGYNNWVIEADGSGGFSGIRVDIPWGEYSGTPVGTVYIPSELADTIVYAPPNSNISIVSSSWNNGEKALDVPESGKFMVTLKQNARMASSSILSVASSSTSVLVTPSSKTVTLSPGEVVTEWFSMQNLGVNTAQTGNITVTVKSTWSGSETANDTSLTFTLVPTSVEQNLLEVTVVEKGANNPIAGMMTYLSYGSGTGVLQTITSSNGLAVFDLGSYSGLVTVLVSETLSYKAASASFLVSGHMQVSLEVEAKKPATKDAYAPDPPDYNAYILIAAGVAAAVFYAWCKGWVSPKSLLQRAKGKLLKIG